MNIFLIIFPFFLVIVAFVCLLIYLVNNKPVTPPEKRAGNYGEKVAREIICKSLTEEDKLFTNISFEYDGRLTELDNIIVNKYGVFIIEVKNYMGELHGLEDDFEWKKYKTTDAGNTYIKNVKNPIKQVKRQIYLLAQYLQLNNINVWVEGFVFFVQGNSPIKNEYTLSSGENIYRALHPHKQRLLNNKTIQQLCYVFQNIENKQESSIKD